MAAIEHAAMTRVVCRIFIKATPQAVRDAICPGLNQSGGYVTPTSDGAGPSAVGLTIGEILAADPPGLLVRAADAAEANSSVRSGLLSFELRDTLTGYTALTVSCEPAGSPGAFDWDRLLGDLKTVLETDGRRRQRTAPTRPSPSRPLRLRPVLVPQAQALSGGRLSPD